MSIPTASSRRRCHPAGGLALLIALAASTTQATPIASLDDIQFWTGAGANRAAIVIDWNSASSTDTALVWGYRWNGQAWGEDMLRAVLVADPRLFAKLSAPGDFGIAVYGIGYDANDNGDFALDDGTSFDADGVAVTGLPDEDAMPLDAADWYREGWFTGIWSYSTASGNSWPGPAWKQSRVGPSGRPLTDGAWDSFTFASPIVLDSFPANPIAATASADFDADGNVDGADFLIWQRGAGLLTGALRSQGDANRDAAVNALDLAAWTGEFASASATPATTTIASTVPELPSLRQSYFALLLCYLHLTTRRNCS